MAPAREATLLLLVAVALALLVAPLTYFYKSGSATQTLVEQRGGRGDEDCKSCSAEDAGVGQCSTEDCGREVALGRPQRNYIKEIVFGGLDGLLTMVAVMVGGIGADLTPRHIFALGLSNLIADAFSMGFGEYVSASAERDLAAKQREQVSLAARTSSARAPLDIARTYEGHGVSAEDALAIANIISKYDDAVVRHMRWEAMSSQGFDDTANPVLEGSIVFMSFVGFGLIPLLGILFPLCLERFLGADWYRPEYSSVMALLISALTLALMGGVVAAYTSGELLRGGLLMLLNGCAASGISFSLSKGLIALAPTPSDLGRSEARRECRETAGDDGTSRRTGSVDRASPCPWPFFRRRFLRGLCLLCLTTSLFAFLVRQLEFSSRKMYETLRVFGWGLFTCISTGLGVIPLLAVDCEKVNEVYLGVANTIAGGMMISASAGMLMEAHDVSGPFDWQIFVGLLCGALFIKGSQACLGEEDEEGGMEALCGALMEKKQFKRAVLIFTVMFCHSAAEGVAVGVAFDKHCEEHFGLYVSLLLAVQNMPEGMAVALVLVPRGVGLGLATLIATLTSVPQPLMAVVAFRYVEAWQSLLPVGLSFAAGAMVYVSVSDLMLEAAPTLGRRRVLGISIASFLVLAVVQWLLDVIAGR